MLSANHCGTKLHLSTRISHTSTYLFLLELSEVSVLNVVLTFEFGVAVLPSHSHNNSSVFCEQCNPEAWK